MKTKPTSDPIITEFTQVEIERLQDLSRGTDILQPSKKTVAHITQMNHQAVRSYLSNKNTIPIDYSYNIPWMTQVGLKQGVRKQDIRIDDPKQILYTAEPNIYLPISPSSIANTLITLLPDEWIFNWFVRNMDEVCRVLEDLQAPITAGDDILILSNHATWFNLPLIAHALNKVFGIPQKNIYTILGPAITHSQWSLSGIVRFSNALKTYPSTSKANTGYSESKIIQRLFFEKINEIFDTKSSTHSSRIILLSPSGTTDHIDTQGNIQMHQPSSGTETLIKVLTRRLGLAGFVVGINDTAIIPSGHSRPKKGKVFAKAGPILNNDWKEILPDSIVDSTGKSIGQWKDS